MALLPPKLNGVLLRPAPFIYLSSPGLPTTSMRFRSASIVLVLAFALGGLLPASAWADRPQPPSHSGWRDGGLPASVRRVQRQTGGEVLRAQPIERDGQEIYRVKVLTPQGRIRVVEDVPQGDAGPRLPRQAPPEMPRTVPQDFQRQQDEYPRQAPQQYPRQDTGMYPRRPPQPRYMPPPRNHEPQ